MIELRHDALTFSFPDVHPEARLSIDFQRTLRIPDDGDDYPLPPGLGRFPIRLVDDFSKEVSPTWLQHGGVMLPMYQSEALWLNFQCGWVESRGQYPFAIKIAAGKINAVSGDAWTDELQRRGQDYLVAPEQPWLDGFSVEKGTIRQFVAMPLGSGYSAEEQLTGEAEFGGLQVIVYPMKREVFERRFPERQERIASADVLYCQSEMALICDAAPDMGLAPGGRMRQEIYEDPFSFDDWEREHTSRCFVHLANSLVWRSITGADPPSVPPTAKEYKMAGLPWFDYYDDKAVALGGSKKLDGLDSVAETGKKKGDVPLPENESITPEHIIDLRRGLKAGQVREGRF